MDTRYTCPFCATEVEVDELGMSYEHHCNFCGAELIEPLTGRSLININGQRLCSKKVSDFLTIDHAIKPVYELKTYHTYDLIECLRLVRTERTKAYDLLKDLNRVIDTEGTEGEEYRKAASFQGKEYESWTRRMWVLENLITERMGYFPERITDEMLIKYKEKSKEVNNKSMSISRDKRKRDQKEVMK